MYVDRMDFSAGLAGTHELRDKLLELGRQRKSAGGFLGQTVLRSYAYPNKLTALGRWEDVQSAWNFGDGGTLTSLFGDAAFDLMRFEGYDTPIEVGEISNATFEQFAGFAVEAQYIAQHAVERWAQ